MKLCFLCPVFVFRPLMRIRTAGDILVHVCACGVCSQYGFPRMNQREGETTRAWNTKLQKERGKEQRNENGDTMRGNMRVWN